MVLQCYFDNISQYWQIKYLFGNCNQQTFLCNCVYCCILRWGGMGMTRPSNAQGGSYPITARIVIPPGTQAYSTCPTRSNVFVVVSCARFGMGVVPGESHVGSEPARAATKGNSIPQRGSEESAFKYDLRPNTNQ